MTSPDQEYFYERGPVLGDLIRSGLGCVISWGPVIFLDPLPVIFWIFFACGCLFTAFGLKTLLKAVTTVSLDDSRLQQSGPLAKSLDLSDLKSVKLRYYATRRKSGNGWMQLNLRDSRQKIVIDSALSGFEPIARLAARWALERNLDIDDTSRENFNALGIRLDEVTPEKS